MAEHLAKTRKDILPSFLFWLIATILLLPWVYIQYKTSINSDVAWLSICAGRLLDGGSLLHDCYDTNPPLSILIYIPFITIGNLLHIQIYDSIFWLTLLWIGFGVSLTSRILQSFPTLNTNENRILSLTYLCSITIIPTIYYAERDHFLAIMILPLILVQLSYTYKFKVAKLTAYPVLLIGGITLLLKPHFGLIPAFLFIHRAVVQKRISVFKDIDFIILSALSIAYLSIIFIYFQDFVNIILPDIIQTYLTYNDPVKTYKTAIPYAVLTAACFALITIIKDRSRSLLIVLGVCAFLSLIIYVIQIKGFTYHRLPLYAVLFPLISILLFKLLQKQSQIITYSFIAFVFAASYLHSPLRPLYPTHEEYQNNKVTNYIAENCASPCSYYMTYENMDIVSQLAFYSGHTYATRFPTYWFMTMLETLPTEEAQMKKMRYAKYIAEDIERFSPSLIFILASSPTISTLENAMSDYKKTDRLSIDRAYFYKGTPYDFPYMLTWDVYKKVSAK